MNMNNTILLLIALLLCRVIMNGQVINIENRNKEDINISNYSEPGKTDHLLWFNSETTIVKVGQPDIYHGNNTKLNTPKYRWSNIFGSSNHYDAVYDLLEDYDKGYYIIGWDVISNNNGNGWDIKTDINGNKLWDNKLILHPPMLGQAVCIDTVGNKYITGTDFTEVNWPFFIKINSCNEKEWCTVYKDWGYTHGSPSDITLNNEGNIIVLTRFGSEYQINQIFLICYSPDGDLLWSRPYASKNNHSLINFAYCTKIYRFGNEYILSGYCYYPYPGNPTHVWMRPLFIGVDSSFNEKWILPFGVSDSVVGKAYSVTPLNDSVFMGVGFKYDVSVGGSGHRSCSMMFFDINGQELGQTTIEDDSISMGYVNCALIESEAIDDSLFLATAVFGPSSFFNPFGDIVFDTSGKVYNAISRPNTRGFSHLVKTHDNKFVVACSIEEEDPEYYDILHYKINADLEFDTIYTQNFIYDSLCPDSVISREIDMSDCILQVGTKELSLLDEVEVKVFPNPADNEITISYTYSELQKGILLQCFSSMGQKVYLEKVSQGQTESKLNLIKWNSGLYIATITIQGRLTGYDKFVVR